jgi:hypothetical protein
LDRDADLLPFSGLLARLRGRASYVLTRFIILRLLGIIYFVAFLILLRQGLPLVGHDGLLPADAFLDQAQRQLGSRWEAFWHLPSIFWLGISDGLLVGVAWAGLAVSAAVICGYANAIMLAVLWALYLSVVHVGQTFYGFGWELELCEAGFLAIFLVPLFDPRPFASRPPPPAVIWLYRWLIFRIMLGAGLIKIRGDSCWRDLTCLDYHYETQPNPNPLTPLFHFAPHWFHRVGVLFNHLCELVVPWFVFGPRVVRHVAGVLLVSFQLLLIAGGNLSFLNWLTVIPALACFDDSFWRRKPVFAETRPSRAAIAASLVLAAAVAVLSVNIVGNLASGQQRMNSSFDPFDLVNTYGAFGSVTRERRELVIEGTSAAELGPGTEWKEYELPCKPGDPARRPCLVAPYHYRLDWQMWFAAMGSPDDAPWAVHLLWKLLHNDAGARSLLVNDPFPDAPPRFVRVRQYRYQLAPLGERGWWRRTLLDEDWLPPVSIGDPGLRAFVTAYGWR